MSKTPKINRVWNKQEKRIVRLLYRKGFDIDLSNLYWTSYKKTGKKYRRKGSTFSSPGYRDEVVFDSIHVYYDNRGDEYNNDASINLQGWGQDYAEKLEKQLIPPETFNKALNDCIDLIRRRLA